MTPAQGLVLAVVIGALAVVAVLRREIIPFLIAGAIVGVLVLGLNTVGWPAWFPHG